jgi:hypothetical protein
MLWHTSIGILATSNLGSLNSAHLRDPSCRRLNLADGTDLIGGISRDADIVATLKSELDVTDLEELATAFLGVLAGCLKDLINEVVGDLEDRLEQS